MPKKRYGPKNPRDQQGWSGAAWQGAGGRGGDDEEREVAEGGEHRRQRGARRAEPENATTTAPSEAPTAGDADAAPQGPEQLGVVAAAWSGGCRVLGALGGEHECVLPSALAANQQSTLAVGDDVRCVGPDAEGAPWRLLEVLPRRTRLARPDPLNPRLERVIAANVERVVHVSSVIKPPIRLALIDRYLIAIEQSGAEPILCLNKIDLVPAEEREEELAELAPYRELGLPIVLCSSETGEGVEELRALLRGHLAVLVGHSGVGKSSLLNALAPEIGARTGEIGKVGRGRNKGRHTTTRSSLHVTADGLRLIDTPGIRELGLLDLDAEGLRWYFPDLQALADGCRFTNCRHDHEPGCAVRAAAEEDDGIGARYSTYLRLLADLETEKNAR